MTCPRSNQWVGVGVPPIERFYASGVRVAVGTDSLASVDDLNLFQELKAMRWIAPAVPARRFLESATRSGATALGLADSLGTIEAGKRAALIAVDLPGVIEDVEEYLVSGISERQIRWVTRDERQTRHVPLVHPLFAFGLRAAVCADRCAAGGARASR